MIKLSVLIAQQPPQSEFMEFAAKRLEGATKITNDAKAKGGPAISTYHHFVVKLPYYEAAASGAFNILEAKRELKNLLNEMCMLAGNVNMNQIHFQQLVGKIEVLGELIIKCEK